ncbi:DUF7269 family protein [Natronosalvus caseinilyticus]|uniref:DUF7269 family protein n=1 Tax=Natronosalvus caseinilyticus TaxID=2953747 RepID=UPI0028A9400C|nr:hypothetical protein [Natronosalvus caseinilyticus]
MSRGPSTLGLLAGTALATGLLALGAGLLYRPATVLEAVPELEAALSTLNPTHLVLAFALVLLIVAPTITAAGRFRVDAPRPIDAGSTEPFADSRSLTDSSSRLAGAVYDDWIDRATAYDDEPRPVRDQARTELVEALRALAADAYATRAGLDRADALEAIRAGTWTDDRRAAAFLADEDGPSTPLSLWLFDLCSTADPFTRGLEHAIEAVEAIRERPVRAGIEGKRCEGSR